MKLFTIGFTKKSAEAFFTKPKRSGTKRVVDARLNNVSQLAGFAKRNDLEFFLREICHMDYVHMPELAPTQDILDEYKKNKGDWAVGYSDSGKTATLIHSSSGDTSANQASRTKQLGRCGFTAVR